MRVAHKISYYQLHDDVTELTLYSVYTSTKICIQKMRVPLPLNLCEFSTQNSQKENNICINSSCYEILLPVCPPVCKDLEPGNVLKAHMFQCTLKRAKDWFIGQRTNKLYIQSPNSGLQFGEGFQNSMRIMLMKTKNSQFTHTETLTCSQI